MCTLSYKGYKGTISYSKDEQVFYGRIDDVADSVSFKAKTGSKVTKEFKDAVEDRLKKKG